MRLICVFGTMKQKRLVNSKMQKNKLRDPEIAGLDYTIIPL